MAKTIFNMADGIFTRCKVARWWHWIRHVTILSKLDHPWQKKITSYRDPRWRISAISDFRGPIMGSLKSPRTTSYRSSIETMALNCLVFEKIAFLYFGDRQTDTQMDRPIAWSRSRCRERRLTNYFSIYNNMKIKDTEVLRRQQAIESLIQSTMLVPLCTIIMKHNTVA